MAGCDYKEISAFKARKFSKIFLSRDRTRIKNISVKCYGDVGGLCIVIPFTWLLGSESSFVKLKDSSNKETF